MYISKIISYNVKEAMDYSTHKHKFFLSEVSAMRSAFSQMKRAIKNVEMSVDEYVLWTEHRNAFKKAIDKNNSCDRSNKETKLRFWDLQSLYNEFIEDSPSSGKILILEKEHCSERMYY